MQYLCQGPCKLEYGFLAQGQWGVEGSETMVSIHRPPTQLIHLAQITSSTIARIRPPAGPRSTAARRAAWAF